ncbi:MurR/RpiR family transcriptional regulator [Pleomorphomonas sp. PLEO]|uniref:MurR/RpiR family transcriptional regulator n=1 Tax=Pleomorphomonas sp. PLEO TaxID=3239306 RepID=UPI00351EFC17
MVADSPNGDGPLGTVERKLEATVATGTPAERRLARFFIDNLANVPFETAASIGQQLHLSPMTVSRFLRRLGFQGLDGLKTELRLRATTTAWQVSDTPDTLQRDLQNGQLLAEVMTDQIETLHRLYALSKQPVWAEAVRRLLTAREVFVASYQNIGGIARYFAEQLAYARDGVRYLDGLNGTYAELLDHPPEGTLLVLVDCRRFASKSRVLAREAVAAGHDLLVVTDQYCDWVAEDQCVLMLPATRSRTWDNFMSLAALLDFLMTSVIADGGEAVRRRTQRIARLQDVFGDFEKR